MDIQDAIYVEDDEQEAFIMRVGMRRQGVTITHVPEITIEAITTLQNPPYDNAVAIIFDAILTGISGVSLARALRASGDERLIVRPVILGVEWAPHPLAHRLNVGLIRENVGWRNE